MFVTTLRDTLYYLFSNTFKDGITKCSQANKIYILRKPSDEVMLRRALRLVSKEFEKALEIYCVWFFKGYDTRQDLLTIIVRTYRKEFMVKFRKYCLYDITEREIKRNNFLNIFRINMRQFLENDELNVEENHQK